jgi:16S rRNA (guanine1207-N2)-methyltransferase
MVDVDTEAVRCARHTIERAGISNARALATDVATGVDGPFDVILSNPPFHVGKHTALEVPRQFILDARSRLAPGGVLWLVANRTLPYESVMHDAFGQVEMVRDGARFKVLRSVVT